MRAIVLVAVAVLGGCAAWGEVFVGDFARLEISARAQVTSLKEIPSGRELLAGSSPLLTVKFTDGERLAASGFFPCGNGLHRVDFGTNSLTLNIEAFRGGWTFRIVDGETLGMGDPRGRRVDEYAFLRLKPVCREYVGGRANAVSDDRSGICLRGYGVECRPAASAASLSASYGLSSARGCAVGLVAGDRGRLPEMLRAMAVAGGIPHSETSGGWSLASPRNRMSYLIADSVAVDTMDDLVEICERTAMGRLHFRSYWDQPGPWSPNGYCGPLGWYPVNTNKFPRGLADLRDSSLKAKAAGLKTSLHNLSGCVGPGTPWMGTEMDDGIVVCHSYTLAGAIPPEGEVDVLYVNEKPMPDHGYDFALWSRGNTIRVGRELFQYSGISRERPYAFTGVRRARFGSRAAAHAAGEKADYLWCFFGTFLADPGTPLAAAVADRHAEIYRAGDFDGIYCDGLDGFQRWADRSARFYRDFFSACARTGKAPMCEDSAWTGHGWWYVSMVGSWDYARWSPKAFTDRHLRSMIRDARLANFQQMTLGWWPVEVGSAASFGYMRDDVEYFGAKTAGHGCGYSLIPSHVRGQTQGFGKIAQETLLGWYERPRTAGIFRPDVLEAFRGEGRDFRLAQDADGVWRVREAFVTDHHMASPSDRAWRVESCAARPVALRVRPLDAGEPWDGKNRLTILSAAMAANLEVSANKGVKPSLSTGTGEHGATLKLGAVNESAADNASWAAAERVIARPFLNLWEGDRGQGAGGGGAAPNDAYAYAVPSGTPLAIGAWVKGDGSGAVVNFQLKSPNDVNSARSEHHLRLDFTGWRYFVFSVWRDHLPEISERYRWPYMTWPTGANYNMYERAVACRSIERVGLWLNGVKRGTAAEVEISDLRIVKEAKVSMEKAFVEVNGERFDLPFALGSGEYAELEDGEWVRYSLGGEPLRRVAAAKSPASRAGGNEIRFGCADDSVRARVTVAELGEKRAAFVGEWTDAAKRTMASEFDYPRFFAPDRGCDRLAPLVTRPGEKARVGYTLIGPASPCELRVGDRTVAVDHALGVNDVVRGVVEGTFSGTVPVTMTCVDRTKTAAKLMLVKRYEGPLP